jgi:hypothetical protein
MPDGDDGFDGTNVPGRISKTVTGRNNIWARPETQDLVGSDLMGRKKPTAGKWGAETKTHRPSRSRSWEAAWKEPPRAFAQRGTLMRWKASLSRSCVFGVTCRAVRWRPSRS